MRGLHTLDRILCSPLVRAMWTAQEIALRAGVVVEDDRDLRERENGMLAGLTEAQALRNGFLRPHLPHETVPCGETPIAFRARAETFWSRLVSQTEPGQRILIVSHGQMIGMLFRCFLRLPVNESVRLRTDDAGIHCWRMDGSHRTVVFSNRRTHLEGAAPHGDP
ncbi:MAG: histidine phosphatase family protein [Planctomycetes bacterium]|nr:histidine phosphatase family protein [Planctomycetota bacterium]